MDPIEIVFQHIAQALMAMPVQARIYLLIWAVFAVLAVLVVFSKNFLGVDSQHEEKRFDDICATLSHRMNNLLPIYQETMQLYSMRVMWALQNNQRVIQLAKAIGPKDKQGAEANFCIQDAHKDSHVVLLAEQMNEYMNQNQ